jgi:hypothetical protein
MIKNVFLFILAVLASFSTNAQELNFSVSIQAPNLNTTDPRVISLMESQIQEFLNTTQWTSDDFSPEERIEGNLLIAISKDDGSNGFTADFTIQSIRPIFNSTQKTTLLNYKEEVSFTYIENQPIRNSEEKYFDNLSSVLTFYAYMAIGMDYDSFSKYGGEKYFNIVNTMILSLPSNVQLSAGWSPSGGNRKRSRYWMVENVLNPRLRSMREAIYTYHRKGLDIMHDDPAKGKAIVLSALKSIERANESYPNAMFVQMFSDSKHDEILEIYLAADRAEKNVVYDIMIGIDPYRTAIFLPLRK